MTLSRICREGSVTELYAAIEDALLETDPAAKCRAAFELERAWSAGTLTADDHGRILPLDDPGRPALPVLVDPRELERRSSASPQGRIRLLHAFAHIEFNAINIALDAAYRFRDLPSEFIGDWLSVARDEARHFTLLADELERRGSEYGACRAHRGLWDMVCKTREDALLRMALVPRVMEARGLDVTPALIDRFRQAGDSAAMQILEVIYRDEIGHVLIGNRWFDWICRQRGLDAAATFRELVDSHLDGRLRGPFNRSARLEAGFTASELDVLEALTAGS